MSYKILLIDSDPGRSGHLQSPLAAAGYEVVIRTDATSAIEDFEIVRPDLAMIDATLPDRHGVQLCRELKRTILGKSTPIILVGDVDSAPAPEPGAYDQRIERSISGDLLVEMCQRLLPAAAAEGRGGKDLLRSSELNEALDQLDSIFLDDALASVPPTVSESTGAFTAAPEEESALAESVRCLNEEASPTTSPYLEVPITELKRDTNADAGDDIDDHLDALFTSTSGADAGPAAPVSTESALPPVNLESADLDLPAPAGTLVEQPLSIAPASKPNADAVPAAMPQELHSTAASAIGDNIESSAFDVDTVDPARRGSSAKWLLLAFAVLVLAAGAIYALLFRQPASPSLPQTASVPVRSVPAALASPPQRENTVVKPDAQTIEDVRGETDSAALPPSEPPASQPRPSLPASSVPPPSRRPEVARKAPESAKPVIAEAAAPQLEPVKTIKPSEQPTRPENSTASSVRSPSAAITAEREQAEAVAIAEAEAAASAQREAAAREEARLTAERQAREAAQREARIAAEREAAAAAEQVPAAVTTGFLPPRVISKVEPVFSTKGLKPGQSETVVLSVLVSETGRISRVVVDKGIPGSDLEAAAVTAVLGWTYEPATENGRPVKAWATARFKFQRP